MREAMILPPRAVTVAMACQYLCVGRSTLYAMIKAGKVPARKIGRRTIFFISDLDRLLANAPQRA